MANLKERWGVNTLGLILILVTFALGGSLCGYLGRVILKPFTIEYKWVWVLLYIVLICILWPFSVLFLSVLTGQYSFFKKYIQKILAKLTR